MVMQFDVADPATQRLQAIEADIRAGRLAPALAALNAFKAAHPADVRAGLFEGLIARASKDSAREIAALQRTTQLAPQWARAQMEFALALSREGRHAEAIAAANSAVELAPGEMPPLEAAVAVATAAGNPQIAYGYLEKASALWPDNAAICRQSAIALTNLGRHAEAEANWRKLLAAQPDDPMAIRNLGVCLAAMGRTDEACAQFEKALRDSPGDATIQFYLAAARGETPAAQPKEVVQGIFDGYASYFDRHLVGRLKYGVPRRITEIIRTRQNGNVQMNVLDLGCGTGLIGVYLGRVAGAFVGVDLSGKMLEQAARHKIYTALRQADLLDELRRSPADFFDYIVAADVFIYVGDVSAVIPACFRVLRPGGALVFSCESTNDAEGALVLRPSKRYAHSQSSIEALCQQSGFARCDIQTMDVRLENEIPIPGYIAVAEKAA